MQGTEMTQSGALGPGVGSSRGTMPCMQSGELSRLEVEELRRAELTYGPVGSTRGGPQVSGYAHVQRTREIGVGRERFTEAATTLLGWDMQRRAGASIRTSSAGVVPDAVAVLRLGSRRLGISAPVRVVYVVDEPSRQGFAYGTLPGHPVSGEEAFVVELGDDGAVTFTVTAFSRPASRLARLGGPLGRAAQSLALSRYLRSL